jgi:Raf kinase inhibitor-like YbhB/YbcL family protein
MAGEHLKVTSPDISDGIVPTRFTCDGAGTLPTLRWNEGPAGTRSFAVLVDDPDAPHPHFVHWLIWGLGPEDRELTADNVGRFVQGKNGFGQLGWGGPCPPRGHGAHRYVFRVHALDCELQLEPGATREALEAAMSGHILMYGELVATYERRSTAAAEDTTRP